MPRWCSFIFQDCRSASIGELCFLHDHVMMIMIVVLVLIGYITLFIIIMPFFYKFLSEGTFIETIWSIIPALLLLILVVPSMKILYAIEDIKSPTFTYKIVGHQWYWTYVPPRFKNLYSPRETGIPEMEEYDSILESYNKESKSPRLLNATEFIFMPIHTTSRLLLSSADVIHSFAVPSIALKVDAFPGRINQLYRTPNRLGIFFGQCSEICGSNHSFIPIRVKVGGNDGFSSKSERNLIVVIFGHSLLG